MSINRLCILSHVHADDILQLANALRNLSGLRHLLVRAHHQHLSSGYYCASVVSVHVFASG